MVEKTSSLFMFRQSSYGVSFGEFPERMRSQLHLLLRSLRIFFSEPVKKSDSYLCGFPGTRAVNVHFIFERPVFLEDDALKELIITMIGTLIGKLSGRLLLHT
jgi:hypothetical protein